MTTSFRTFGARRQPASGFLFSPLLSILLFDKGPIVLETGIKITLVAGQEMEVFGLRDREQVIKDIHLVRDAFGAQFDFDVNATINERLPVDSDPKFDSSGHIYDPPDDDNLLGLYHPFDSSIELFVDNCSKVAAQIGQPPNLTVRKVLFHELGHLVSHAGLITGTCAFCGEEALFNWRHFPRSPSEPTEHFAQVAAYIAILDLNDAKLEDAMVALSKNQSINYRSWEAHRARVQAGLPPSEAKRDFQNQFQTALEARPNDTQVPRREHLHCYFDASHS